MVVPSGKKEMQVLAVFLVLLGIALTITREIIFAYTYGTSRELELFRLYFAVPAAILGLVGQSYISVASASLISQFSKVNSNVNFVQGRRFALLITLVFLLTYPFQLKYLINESFSITNLPILLLMTGIVFLTTNSFWIRADLLANKRPELAAIYPVIFWAIPILMIVTSSSFGRIPTLPELAIYFCASSFLTLVMMLFWYFSNIRGRHSSGENKRSELFDTFIKSVIVLSIFRLVNTSPRFVDRAVTGAMEDGSLAALEYSFSILSVPVTFLTILFSYIGIPYIVKSQNVKTALIGVSAAYSLISLIAMVGLIISMEYIVPHILIRGQFTIESFGITKQFFDIQVFVIVPLTLNYLFSLLLVHWNKYEFVFFAVLLKLFSKVLGLLYLFPGLGREEVAKSFVFSEFFLLFILAIGVFFSVKHDLQN